MSAGVGTPTSTLLTTDITAAVRCTVSVRRRVHDFTAEAIVLLWLRVVLKLARWATEGGPFTTIPLCSPLFGAEEMEDSETYFAAPSGNLAANLLRADHAFVLVACQLSGNGLRQH